MSALSGPKYAYSASANLGDGVFDDRARRVTITAEPGEALAPVIDGEQFSGLARLELSLGTVDLIPWTAVRCPGGEWLAPLWRAGDLKSLCIRTTEPRQILGLRAGLSAYQAFRCAGEHAGR